VGEADDAEVGVGVEFAPGVGEVVELPAEITRTCELSFQVKLTMLAFAGISKYMFPRALFPQDKSCATNTCGSLTIGWPV
jgi:hypothetical protein